MQAIHAKFPNIQARSEYISANLPMDFECSLCGHQWKTVARSVLKYATWCPKCGVATTHNNRAKERFLQDFTDIVGDKYEFVNYETHEKISIRCKTCGNIRTTNINNLKRYSGCRHCQAEEWVKDQRLTIEQFIEKANIVHHNKYDYSLVKYVNNKTKVRIICPTHGEFLQAPVKHVSGHQGCPICAASYGENQVGVILDLLKIEYIKQYSVENYDDSPYSHPFHMDYYLELNGNKYAIEFNGYQHYHPIEYFGGIQSFLRQQKRDNYIREWCAVNDIKLLEIKYNQINEMFHLICEFLNCRLSEESDKLLSGNIGEDWDVNTEINSEIKESESSYSVESETV